ncbi:protein FAM83G [Hemicordylus capensis]|uniref:protein FAM83G n=1 Tax=Hemicordylus capensis TaxID=884348 RepID=UPI00230462C8|nr:protein FAM83G [Hemicordylus capensis]
MALSQVQCLDDSHVNWRSSESKPEFFYSEEQRLALEALVSKGPEAFYEVLKKENIRDFLSELELKKILDTLETYDPGSEFIPRGDVHVEANSQSEELGPVPSLEYWPERSDRSIPQLDLGWPETVAYRGVTRATVYMQPPIDFQPHIKEVVRKMIFQAQKVVAVVMDMFTDVDIFKDLLDAGFKRKVAIYIILDESNLKYFLQMCERAQMHAGHLKNLRVRTTGGTEFFTHSATRFKGNLAQKFMFVDGDKAMCGSYSFTWSAARTDRNVISVLTGQVVEAFDKQFQELYLMSRGISLKSIPVDEEPEPEPMILPSIMPVNPSNAAVKKMVNPKYALVKAKSAEQISSSHASSNKNLADRKRAEAKGNAIPEGRVSERPSDMVEMAPALHPGLVNLEKANMFDYLPTWVEPDPEPGSEILGYINIIDPKIKNIQLSQINRIKVCDVSQANAQHKQMLKQKAQEAKRNHNSQPASSSPHQLEPASPSVPMQEVPNLVASPMDKTPRKLENGETFATLASSQHLKKLDVQVHDQTDAKDIAPPVPKPRTVPVTDLTSMKTAKVEDGAATEDGPQAEGGGTNGKHSENAAQVEDPRSHHKLSRQTAVSAEAVPGPVNGVKEDEAEEEDFITLSNHGSLSGSSANHSHRRSNASSISDEYFEVREHAGLLRRTNSDFFPNGSEHDPQQHPRLQRKLSEPHMSRGTFVSPLGSPQPILSVGLNEAFQSRRRSDSVEEIRCVLGRGHNLHALPDGHITCPSNAPQGPQLFCYGSRVQLPTGRGKSGAPQGKNPGDSKYHQDTSRAKKASPGPACPPYWQNKGFSSSKNTQPAARFSQGGKSPSRATGNPSTPFKESQRASEEIRTPLGIPLSKLSQSKHLKNRAGQWSDSKRRQQGAAGRKDQ